MNDMELISEIMEALITDDYEHAGESRGRPAKDRRADEGTQASGPAKHSNEEAPIPIFFTIDDSYAPFLGVALHSLIKNASPTHRYDINIMHDGLSAAHARQLMAFDRPGFAIRLFKTTDKIASIEDAHHNKLRQDYFTPTIFFRLFIPALFPEYDKGIYLDSDIVVPGDIARLYETDLEGNLIGACRDLSIVDVPELVAYTNNAVGVGVESYVNSGVLLMDLAALRRAKLHERFLGLLEKYRFPNIAPDQDYLNALCFGKILYLDPSWDAMPVVGKKPLEHPNLIHYNLFAKPWCYDDIPYERYFWSYAEESPFAEEVRAFKAAYGDEQKESDARCLQALISHGAELARADFNFRTVFNEGKEPRL